MGLINSRSENPKRLGMALAFFISLVFISWGEVLIGSERQICRQAVRGRVSYFPNSKGWIHCTGVDIIGVNADYIASIQTFVATLVVVIVVVVAFVVFPVGGGVGLVKVKLRCI